MSRSDNDPFPRAVLFDFDGVIVNSEPIHCAATIEVMSRLGMPLTEETYYKELIGFDDRGGFGHLFKLNGHVMDELTAQQVIAAKNEIVLRMIRERGIVALPGAVDLIRRLANDRVLAICSGALRNEIETMLDAIGLRVHFPVIVAGGEVAVGKPDPAGYLLTVKLLNERFGQNLLPADCLVIEDSPKVSAGARGVGFRVLGVLTSHGAEKWFSYDHLASSLRAEDLSRVGLSL